MSSTKVIANRANLKGARVTLGLEQSQLAEAAGLSKNAISNFERGKTKPHEATREAIQSALEARGIVFTNGDRPGFYFDKEKAVIPT